MRTHLILAVAALSVLSLPASHAYDDPPPPDQGYVFDDLKAEYENLQGAPGDTGSPGAEFVPAPTVTLEEAGLVFDDLIGDARKLSASTFIYLSVDRSDRAGGWGTRVSYDIGKGNRVHLDVASPDWKNQNSEDSLAFVSLEHDFGWQPFPGCDPFFSIMAGGDFALSQFGGGVGGGVRISLGEDYYVAAAAYALSIGGEPTGLFGLGAGVRF